MIGYLAEAFILSANLNDDVTINTEVALLIACIFHFVTSRCQLVGKECLAHSSYLWLLQTECVKQIRIVEVYLVWLL